MAEIGPLERALSTGEVYCPIRTGTVAIEACTTLAARRANRCEECGCPWRHIQETFLVEIKRSREGNARETRPRQTRTRRKVRPKTPATRPWQSGEGDPRD